RPARPPRSPRERARSCARAPPRRAPREPPPRRAASPSAERALQLVEEPLVRLVRLVRRQTLELLEQHALNVRELRRHEDVHEHSLIPAAESLQRRKAAPAQDDDLSRLRARLERELCLAVEGRYRHGRPERGLRQLQLDGAVHVVPLADEALVGTNMDLDVDITRASSERSRVTLTAEADALPVVD